MNYYETLAGVLKWVQLTGSPNRAVYNGYTICDHGSVGHGWIIDLDYRCHIEPYKSSHFITDWSTMEHDHCFLTVEEALEFIDKSSISANSATKRDKS
mgnify:CR=1 FL=1